MHIRSSIVQHERKGVVAELSKRVVVMSIHVSSQEVKDRHVHQIQQSSPAVVRRLVTYFVAVGVVYFPLSFVALVVRTSPRVTPRFTGDPTRALDETIEQNVASDCRHECKMILDYSQSFFNCLHVHVYMYHICYLVIMRFSST